MGSRILAGLIKGIRIPNRLMEQMSADIEEKANEEACGLLAGTILQDAYQVTLVLPMTNMLHSAVRFRIEPHEQLQAFNQIEMQRLELVGIYHSHPSGPDEPSKTDIAESYYPDAANLIWSGRTGEWRCRAFFISQGAVREIPILNEEEN
jgi:proteasome lid subunit RPN8/RPN11